MIPDITHLHIYKMCMLQIMHTCIKNVYVPVTAWLQCSVYVAIYCRHNIDKEIQLCGAYDRSTRCWPLLLGTAKAKVELRIGYTLGSQCIPGIYARWFLITHKGVISKPPSVLPGIHGYLGYNQFVG